MILGCLLLMVGVGTEGWSQQIPIYNQHVYQPVWFNPAAYGDGFIGLQYRSQFAGLDSRYAPRSFGLTADLSSLLHLSEKKIGVGLSLLTDKVHLLNRLKGKFSFAYHLVRTANHRLSAGLEAGLFSQRIDFGDSRIADPQDVVLYEGESNKTSFDGGFGLHYRYTSDTDHELNVHVATPQLFTSDLTYDEDHEFDVSPHLLTALSYRIPIQSFSVEPHLMYRDILGEKSLKKGKTDICLRLHFLDNRFWVGGGYPAWYVDV